MAPTQASLQSLASRPEAYVPPWETTVIPWNTGGNHIFRLLHILGLHIILMTHTAHYLYHWDIMAFDYPTIIGTCHNMVYVYIIY